MCNANLKVLVVTTSYPRNDDDLSGTFIKRLAVTMVRAGTGVTVLAPGDRDAQARESSHGVQIVRFVYAPRALMRIGYGHGGIPENLRRSPWLFALLPFFLFSMIIHVIRLAKDCDVIHANWLHTGLLSLPAQKIRKKPLVVTLRGSDVRWGASNLLPFVLSRADAVTTVNKTWAVHLKQRFGHKVYYAPNGVQASEKVLDVRGKFSIGPHQIIVLYMGVLRKVKGADLLADIAKITLGLDPSVSFLVVGPGSPQGFGLDRLPNVICVGQVSPEAALEVYAGCDVFILPSRSEGRPNALLEAMASGLPSVAARVPGAIEILTDECGVVVNKEDAPAFAEAICTLARDPVRRKNMGEKARARISTLSLDWESSAKTYFKIFAEVRPCVAFAE